MLWITIFAFGSLAASVFIKRTMVYIAVLCSWAAVIFAPQAADISGYLKLVAVAVCVFAIQSILRIRKEGEI